VGDFRGKHGLLSFLVFQTPAVENLRELGSHKLHMKHIAPAQRDVDVGCKKGKVAGDVEPKVLAGVLYSVCIMASDRTNHMPANEF
jgi:hypothetical protein